MAFYRTMIAAVAAMGLATAVFADDTSMNTTTQNPSDTTATTTTQTQTTSSTTDSQSTDQTKVDLNKASAKELMKVKGLNSARAKAIVSYRKKHGDFKSVDDLKMVKGFKKVDEKTMKQLEDQLTTG